MPSLPLCARTSGTSRDGDGYSPAPVVAGANVTVTNTATNVARQVQTNGTGNYTAPFLVPGMYTSAPRHSSFSGGDAH